MGGVADYCAANAQTIMMLAPRAVKRKISAKATHSAEVSNAASTSAAAEGASTGEASSGGINVEQAVDSPASDGKDTEVIGQSAGIAENKIDTEEATAIASTSESQHGGEKDKKNRKEQERLNLLRFTVEECLSDWGLSCLHPELLQILKDSTTGCENVLPRTAGELLTGLVHFI